MKTKSLIVFSSILFLSFITSDLSSQPNLEWSRYFHSPEYYDEEAKSMCFDDSLNIYLAGGKKILKYNPSGDLVWDVYFPNGGTSNKILHGSNCFLASGSNGLIKLTDPSNIIVISNENFVDIQKGADNFIYGIANNTGSIITQKYTANGSLIWSKIKQRTDLSQFNSFAFFQGVSNKINIFGRYISFSVGYTYNHPLLLTYDTIGNILFNGEYPEGMVKGVKNGFLNNNIFTGYRDYNTWHSDILMYKLNSENTVLSSIIFNGSGNGRDEPNDIVCDPQGNIYLACRSWGVAVNYDFVVLKFNSNMDLIWEYRFNGSENSYDKADKIILDNSGNVYASGTLTLNSHGIQIYTVKLSPGGQLLWSDKFSRYNSITDSNYVNDLKIDNSGNIYLCGKSRDSINHRYDILTLKYSDPTSIVNSEGVYKKDFSILQNYPNPFNPVTNIKFNLSERSKVIIDIISADGRKLMQLANSVFTAGEHHLFWDAESFNSGIYFISFQSDNCQEIKKAVLVK